MSDLMNDNPMTTVDRLLFVYVVVDSMKFKAPADTDVICMYLDVNRPRVITQLKVQDL
jgi:hypothetical protein